MEFLRVSENGHFLTTESGAPFFWLGDTTWELFHRMTREEADTYLENRAKKGFNVIQAVVLSEFDGLHTPNAYGHLPLKNDDPTQLVEDYFLFVNDVIHLAETKGLYIGLFPTWGDKVDLVGGTGPLIFNVDNAYVYGNLLGKRYRDQSNVIWILGGDRYAEGFESIWRAMAQGILAGTDNHALITYHPRGPGHSATALHNESWLSFNMIQSGHGKFDEPNWEWIEQDYNRIPAKPVLDSEPNYDNHPVAFDAELKQGRFTDYDVRKAAYRAILSGACGHTYGHHSVWQRYQHGQKGTLVPDQTWTDALDAPGAFQMTYLKNLFESRPFLTCIPDKSLVLSSDKDLRQPICASRDADGSYALIYIPFSDVTVTVKMDALSGSHFKPWWYDPCLGVATQSEEFDRCQTKSFTTPSDAPDWVLVIDNAERGFPPPGQV